MGATTSVFQEINRAIGKTITVYQDKKIQFRDTGIYINSSSDGVLNIVSDTSIASSGAWTHTGDLTITGSFTFGDATVDTLIINGRVATSSVAGAALDIDSAYTYNELMELRASVSDFTNIPQMDYDSLGNADIFATAYLRAEVAVNGTDNGAVGIIGWGVANAQGCERIEGGRFWAYAKGDATKTVDYAWGVRGEFSMDAGRSNTLTITEAAGVVARITSGKVNAYTNIHGFIGRFGDMDGGSRTYGNGIYLLAGPESGTPSLTRGLYINIACTTGISLAGAMTDGLLISGACGDNGIEITGACTDSAIQIVTGGFATGLNINADGTTAINISSNFTGTTGLLIAGTSTNAVSVTGNATSAFTTGTGTFGTGLTIGGTVTTGISIGACSGNAIEVATDDKIQLRDSGVYIHSDADGGIKISADTSGILLDISGSSAAKKIMFGGETDWGTGATGTVIDGTGYDWVTQTVGRVNSDLSGTAVAAGYHAMTVTVSQTSTTSVFGTWTELYFANSVAMTGASNAAAVWGQVECGSSVTGPDQSDGDFMCAGYFNFKTGATFTTGSYVNGVRIQSEVSSSSYTLTGSTWMAGIEVLTKSGSYQNWTYGAYISGADTGIYVTGTSGSATGKAFSSSGWTIDAGNLTDGYGAIEADLTMTGTATGHMAALSAWININTGTAASGGNFLAAQTNGIYEGASGTITGANVIFGMRMDCICTHSDASGFYPFSIVNNANTTTALFQCNANTDMGIVSDAGSTRGELCPLLKLPDGTVKYVLLYDHT